VTDSRWKTTKRSLLVRALEKTEATRRRPRALLRITRDTLRYKMKKFNLGSPVAQSS